MQNSQKGPRFKHLMRHKAAPLLLILIVLTIVTMIISSGVLEGEEFSAMFRKGLLSRGNLLNIFYKMVVQLFMLGGIVLLLIGGNIDLSVAGQAGINAMVFAWLCQNTALPWGVVFLICIGLAVGLGLVNTFLVNILKFPSFIATIGMASVYAGLCNVITSGNNIQVSRQSFIALGKISFFNYVPLIFVIALAVMIIYQFILARTTFGRSVYMCGGNRNAARLSGLNPQRMTMLLFINNSVLAAIGGLLYTAQIKLASPTALINSGFDFLVISASILGGVAFFGGAGSIGGGFIGLLLLNVFDNMLTILKVPDYWIVFASGFVLVVALIIDYIGAERRRKALLIAATSGS